MGTSKRLHVTVICDRCKLKEARDYKFNVEEDAIVKDWTSTGWRNVHIREAISANNAHSIDWYILCPPCAMDVTEVLGERPERTELETDELAEEIVAATMTGENDGDNG